MRSIVGWQFVRGHISGALGRLDEAQIAVRGALRGDIGLELGEYCLWEPLSGVALCWRAAGRRSAAWRLYAAALTDYHWWPTRAGMSRFAANPSLPLRPVSDGGGRGGRGAREETGPVGHGHGTARRIGARAGLRIAPQRDNKKDARTGRYAVLAPSCQLRALGDASLQRNRRREPGRLHAQAAQDAQVAVLGAERLV